jgi:hypothetical protein
MLIGNAAAASARKLWMPLTQQFAAASGALTRIKTRLTFHEERPKRYLLNRQTSYSYADGHDFNAGYLLKPRIPG